MRFIFRNSNIYMTLNSMSRLYSGARKTHYEILNVPKNCSDKQIKDAYIQLSKEYHPDKNKDAQAQEKFVRIVEAYNVLSKPSSRAKYDCTGVQHHTPTYDPYRRPSDAYAQNYSQRNYQYTNFYEHAHRSSSNADTEEKPYYGIHNVNKVNNSVLLFICVGVALIGFTFQMLLIRQSFLSNRRRVDEKSQLIAMELDKVRTTALENGNERQTQMLIEKIVNGSNATVATASLGQSLANPKRSN